MAKKKSKLNSKKWPTLYKQGADGEKVIEWDIDVQDLATGHATLTTTYGQKDGKKHSVSELFTEGKNLGKKNETTPYQQAVNEAQGKWNKKKDRNKYSESVEDCGEKRAVAPMLALVLEDHVDKVDWNNAYVQPKLDGFRCIARCTEAGVTLESREGKAITTMGHIVDALDEIMKVGEVFDGELYAHRETFSTICKWIKKVRPENKNITYHVYDNPTLATEPFWARYNDLWNSRGQNVNRMKASKFVKLVLTEIAYELEDVSIFQRKCLGKGYEGAMLRHGKAGYEFGKRSSNLLKVKTFVDAEFEIVNYRQGKGKCAGMCVFICKAPSGGEFEVFAPGPNEEKKKIWKNRKQYLGKKLTVKYQEMTTTEKPVPRFPVALRFYQKL